MKLRLTLWYGGALTAVLLLYAGGVYAFERNSLYAQLDDQLHDDFELAEHMLEPAEGGVKVVWVDAGDLGMNPMSRWFGLFLDGMIGPDFEKGLAKMKRLGEAAPK